MQLQSFQVPQEVSLSIDYKKLNTEALNLT